MEQIKVIQQNIIKWTPKRWNELFNLYSKENPEVIILNATGITDEEIVKIYGYKLCQRNKEG